MISILSALAVFAALTLPPLDGHLKAGAAYSAFGRIGAVLADTNHLKVFGFSALMMLAGFTVIPYLAINLQYGLGLRTEEIPYAYLWGGLCAFATARWIGRLTDRWGKVRSFQLLAVAVIVPVFGITLLPWGSPVWLVIAMSALFMICADSFTRSRASSSDQRVEMIGATGRSALGKSRAASDRPSLCVAMGLQATALRRVGQIAVATTYGTGAIVRVGEKVALAARRADRPVARAVRRTSVARPSASGRAPASAGRPRVSKATERIAAETPEPPLLPHNPAPRATRAKS